MHYKIKPGIIVKTENAAKPTSQASAFLKLVLADLPHVSATVDYGCGKLRYCDAILARTDTLTIVDSEIQLSRTQIINGVKSNIREAVSGSNRIRVYNDSEFEKSSEDFDRAFCINVPICHSLYFKEKTDHGSDTVSPSARWNLFIRLRSRLAMIRH